MQVSDIASSSLVILYRFRSKKGGKIVVIEVYLSTKGPPEKIIEMSVFNYKETIIFLTKRFEAMLLYNR